MLFRFLICAFVFPIFIYVFLSQSPFNCQSFSTYLRVGKRLKEQCFCPQPTKKTMSTISPHRFYCQIAIRCSMYWMHSVCVGGAGQGWGVRVLRETLKTNHISGLISSKWRTSYKIFGCWQDDPALEYKEVAPSLTKQIQSPQQKSGLPSKTNMVFNLCDALKAMN